MFRSINIFFPFQQHIRDGLTESLDYAGQDTASEDVELVHSQAPTADLE